MTLAKTRRMLGPGMGQKVFFGVHCALRGGEGREGAEAGEKRTVRVGDQVVPVRRRSGEGEVGNV